MIMDKKQNDGDSDRDILQVSRKSFYDLSHLIFHGMPIYPGNPHPQFQPFYTLEKDKANVTRLTLGSHTGTHVDAPKHFVPNGNSVDEISLEKLMGEAIVLDVSEKAVGEGITNVDLDIYSEIVKQDDIVLLYTGTSDQWNKNDSIMRDFTYLEPSAAKWIVDHNIKCIGIDSFSVEKYNFNEGLSHRALLSRNIGIIEGLNSNLKKCLSKRMFLVCLPLFLKGIDGAPARVIAFDII